MMNTPFYGGHVESWKPGCLIQDEEDVAYEPDDRQGKALALYITFKIRLLLHKTKFAIRTEPPNVNHPMCRCTPPNPISHWEPGTE